MTWPQDEGWIPSKPPFASKRGWGGILTHILSDPNQIRQTILDHILIKFKRKPQIGVKMGELRLLCITLMLQNEWLRLLCSSLTLKKSGSRLLKTEIKKIILHRLTGSKTLVMGSSPANRINFMIMGLIPQSASRLGLNHIITSLLMTSKLGPQAESTTTWCGLSPKCKHFGDNPHHCSCCSRLVQRTLTKSIIVNINSKHNITPNPSCLRIVGDTVYAIDINLQGDVPVLTTKTLKGASTFGVYGRKTGTAPITGRSPPSHMWSD